MAKIARRVLDFRERQRRVAVMRPSTFAEIEHEAAARGARDPEAVAGAAYWKTLAARYRGNPSSVHGMAVHLGYPYLRGEGRVAKDGSTWLSRVTKTVDGTGPALFIGWDQIKRKWVIEEENKNPFDWREARAAGDSPLGIRHGDRVTFLDRFGQQRTGRVVMRSSSGGWVLNMGGAHGTPAVVHEDQIVKIRKANPSERAKIRAFFDPAVEKWVASVYHEKAGNLFRVRKTKREAVAALHDEVKRLDREPFRRNPDDGELSAAEDLYKTFHGRDPREILELTESAETRGEYTGLGDLVELTIDAPNGDRVVVNFKDDGVRLASSPEGTQLYLLGGTQDISGVLGKFGADSSKDLVDLGELKQVVYDAAKWQTDFTPQEWKHDLGEESGIRPRAFYDQLKKRIFFAGGTYRVKRPGIVD